MQDKVDINRRDTDFRAEYCAKFKTGRRESRRDLTLHLGQRTAKTAECGHRVIATSKPSSGCFDCWHYFFSLNAKMVFACYDFLRTGREAEVRDAHGTKFVKMFKRYVMHVQSLAPIEPSDAVSAEVS
jgi:hypothetical protein